MKKLREQVGELEEKLAALAGDGEGTAGRRRFCSQPEVPPRTLGPWVSERRARLIRLTAEKWVNGTTLRYYFFRDRLDGGGKEQEDLVREGFEIWREIDIGIAFKDLPQHPPQTLARRDRGQRPGP